MTNQQRQCDKCNFHVEGQCRRKSPEVIVAKNKPETIWPITQDTDWCGESSMAMWRGN